MTYFVVRLGEASASARSLLCVGLDPDPARMPVPDVAEFNRAIVDATADLVCAYKPNLAFYEALGLAGLRALDDTVSYIRLLAPHCIIIGDAKRGDIGSSVAAYATAMFDRWGFDAVTVNAWGGADTVEPWLGRPERGIFVWCRSSNPGAGDWQDSLVGVPGESLYLRLARRLQERAGSDDAGRSLGLVVGATGAGQLASVRRACPDLPLLIPGVGAQQADLPAAVRDGVDAGGRGAIISSSRGVIYATVGLDYAPAARRSAMALRDGINWVLADMGLGWG